MLVWTVIFLIIAVVAAVLGFTNVAIISTDIARIIFVIFLILFIGSLVFQLFS